MRAKAAKKAKPRKPAKGAAAPAPEKAAYRPEDLARAFSRSYAPPPTPSSTVVTLDPDVAPHFRDSRAVNEALRALLRIVRQVRGG